MSKGRNMLHDDEKLAAINKMVVENFYKVEPDAAILLFKITKFAKAKPAEYSHFKKLLDREIIKLKSV